MRKRGVKGPRAGAAKKQAFISPPGRRKTAIAAAFAALISGPATPASADWYGNEYAQCQGATAAIVRCLGRLTATWQGRLDQAYEKLHTEQDTPERKAALQEAQRLWTEYRKLNCTFYSKGPGSIAAIEAAECMRALTRRRALELDQAINPERR